MYQTELLLLSFCCVALLYFRITIVLRNSQVLNSRLFLVCFDLPLSNKKLVTYNLASLPMTQTPKIWSLHRFHWIFVIARPWYKNNIDFNSIRPKQSKNISITLCKSTGDLVFVLFCFFICHKLVLNNKKQNSKFHIGSLLFLCTHQHYYY